MTEAENSAPKQRGFQKGKSGNPAGKPPGTRNKMTLLAEALLDNEAEALARVAIDRALEGDRQALRLCLDRIVPPRKDRLRHAEDRVRQRRRRRYGCYPRRRG